MKNFFRLIGLCSCLFLLGGCGIFGADGFPTAYHGRVLDTETREPIEGAVALGEWSRPVFMGHNTKFLAARDAVTDKNGEFVIPSPGPLFSPKSEVVYVIKAGYTSASFYRSGYKTPNHKYRKKFVKWEGKNPIVLLRKLTKEEIRKFSAPSPPLDASYEEIKHYLAEMDRIDVARGLKPRGSWKGKRISYE